MKIVNLKLLAEFSRPGVCENCGKPCPDGRDPHHILTKGAGRVDIRENLCGLCRACHNGFHSCGKPSAAKLFGISAKREGTTAQEAQAKIWEIRRS